MLAETVPHPVVANRLLPGGLDDSLIRFNDPALLAAGKIVMISLDAVVERLGNKWALRCDQVYEHAERTLERIVGPQGYHLKVSGADYLICQPETGRFVGQANALRALREILGHFLGAAGLADTGVHEVVKVYGRSIEAHQLDAVTIDAEAVHEAKAAVAQSAPAGADECQARFVSADGRALRVSCALEPVFELKNFNRIGMRLARRVLANGSDAPLLPDQLSALARADILRVDLATIGRGLERLRAGTEAGRHPTLIVPVSFTTLSSQQGCHDVVKVFQEAATLVRNGVICEICDIAGAPSAALSAAVSVIRPFALYVVGRLGAGHPTATGALKGLGLHGLSLDLPAHGGEPELTGGLRAHVEAARRIARSVMVYGLPSAREAGMVALLGATHAGVRARS
ncbi:hypothetical protein [Phenylobacterium sp.]|jgi:hypothetical protein|uniref:hypothetical protein n=1 Tax=Phenylobacterium sp. TaxID=1871053 RepID=UPI002F408D55